MPSCLCLVSVSLPEPTKRYGIQWLIETKQKELWPTTFQDGDFMAQDYHQMVILIHEVDLLETAGRNSFCLVSMSHWMPYVLVAYC